ncbi:unnamed protein product, partial [Didymodactylos carnosus]
CRYDLDVCNVYEQCFDDSLFGQCLSGIDEGQNTNLLPFGNILSDDKLIALDITFDFLKRYQLNWKDYVTQCILIRILKNQDILDKNTLDEFYVQCINEDETLDTIVSNNENNDDNVLYLPVSISNKYENNHRRYVETDNDRPRDVELNEYDIEPWQDNRKNLRKKIYSGLEIYYGMWRDPYITNQASSANFMIETLPYPSLEYKNRKHKVNFQDAIYMDDPVSVEELYRSEPIADQSIMSENPRKISLEMKEKHPGLIVTLQVNNNRQQFPGNIISQETMIDKNGTSVKEQSVNKTNTDNNRYYKVETDKGYIAINREFKDQVEGSKLLALIAQTDGWPLSMFNEVNVDRDVVTFHLLDNPFRVNATNVASSAFSIQKDIERQLGVHVVDAGIGASRGRQLPIERENGSKIVSVTIVICLLVAFTMAAIGILFFIKRNVRIRDKLAEITHIKGFSTKDYQDLCRQRMQNQPQAKMPDIHNISSQTNTSQTNTTSVNIKSNSEGSSNRSSTSSWSEEPLPTTNMDIMTGHLILSYMEDHLQNRNRLEAEWQELCNYENDQGTFITALSDMNTNKNRYIDILPYDHSRVLLTNNLDKENNDYINASPITDSDPKCKYIATQGPLPHTTNAFWQMVWENGSSVIVALTRPIEDGVTMSHHYWPVAGSERFTDFEVNLVSEHIWCDDYLVRSFYLKNVQTMDTRTVTQFHFLTWSELGTPPSAKSLLDFR